MRTGTPCGTRRRTGRPRAGRPSSASRSPSSASARSRARRSWGIQFQRSIPANGEESFWAPIRPDEDRYVSRFGRLVGLEGLRAPNGLEIQPYVATRLTREPGDAADPFYSENDVLGTAGADVKYGITSNLTLTATINPDFGQVEADPAVVNLTAFETFFEERRPFFLEGTDIFGFGRTRTYRTRHTPTFFYSRRIGRQPTSFGAVYGGDVEYDFSDTPDQTTIASAVKLSGKVGDWSVGVLDAVTTPEFGEYLGVDGTRDRLVVEPLGELRGRPDEARLPRRADRRRRARDRRQPCHERRRVRSTPPQ